MALTLTLADAGNHADFRPFGNAMLTATAVTCWTGIQHTNASEAAARLGTARPPGAKDRLAANLWVPENRVISCDLGIFVDQAADPHPAQNPDIGIHGRRMRAPSRRTLMQRPMRPVSV